jgi:hypothetical protein
VRRTLTAATACPTQGLTAFFEAAATHATTRLHELAAADLVHAADDLTRSGLARAGTTGSALFRAVADAAVALLHQLRPRDVVQVMSTPQPPPP